MGKVIHLKVLQKVLHWSQLERSSVTLVQSVQKTEEEFVHYKSSKSGGMVWSIHVE